MYQMTTQSSFGYLRLCTIVACLCLCTACARSPDSKMLNTETVTLSNGNTVKRYTLSNQFISVTVIPELGGKITSIKSQSGREFLSRSDKAYQMRRYGMKYGETEFDGIDECFPSVATSQYPSAPWKDRPIPDHGELCQLAWTVTQLSNDSIHCEVHGKGFPYVFTRSISIHGRAIHLDYQVENRSANPFHCSYAFHPLLAGEEACGLALPDDTKIHMDISSKNHLGEKGSTASWSQYLDLEGKLFKDNQFNADSKKYYKYYTEALKTGHVRFFYTDGHGLTMTWPSKLFPYLAVWCSQGAVGGLSHLAPEPTNTVHDGLAEAYEHKQSLLINGNDQLHWRISLLVEEPMPEVEVEQAEKPAEESAALTAEAEAETKTTEIEK